jgi:glutathione S-transferase
MFKLYGNPGAASVAPHVMLIEAHAPHEFINVDLDSGEHLKPEYRRINPHGLVPTLIEGDHAMYESAAITMYLCERFPETGLMPGPGTPERPRFLQWMMYLTNTVQTEHMHYWHPDNYMDSEAGRAELHQTAERRLGNIWAHIDGALATGGPYLTGADCTAADIFLTMLTRWSRKLAKPPADLPHLKALASRVKARPAYKAMMKAEGID